MKLKNRLELSVFSDKNVLKYGIQNSSPIKLVHVNKVRKRKYTLSVKKKLTETHNSCLILLMHDGSKEYLVNEISVCNKSLQISDIA